MISVPIIADSLQEPVIILGEPVKLAGRVLGVVLGVASLQPIREMTTASSGASEVYVVDNRGRIVAHSDPSQPLAADFSKVPIVEEFMTGRQRAGGTVNFALDKRPMVGTFMPLTDKSGWGVVVQTDEDTAYADGDRSCATSPVPHRRDRDRARRGARHAVRRRDQPPGAEARGRRAAARGRRLRARA